MPRFGRSSAFRWLGRLVLAAQVVVYALAPLAEARANGVPETGASIERGHTESCVVVHRPDVCVACQLATVRAPHPQSDADCIPHGGSEIAVAPPRTAHRAPRTAVSPGLHSRAPPASAA